MKSNQATDTDTETQLKTNQGGRLPLNRYALFFLPCIIGAAADLITKSYVFNRYFDPKNYEQQVHYWVDGVFGIQTSTNPGALFGFAKGQSLPLAIFSIVALVGIVLWLFKWRAAVDRWLTLALGLISGGIIGNCYDRLGFGYVASYDESIRYNVRDWLYFYLEGVPFFQPWPNFNIADSVLVTGAIMLFLHAIFVKPPELNQASVEDEQSANQIETAT